jgi:hypothetical protein
MRSARKNFSLFTRVVCFLLAAYLLNFSIDNRDPNPDSVAEDLTVNDIESVYELLAESVAGVENAVEEHDERDQEDGGSFEFKKFYFAPLVSRIQVREATYIPILYSPIDYCDLLVTRANEINSPPPRA